MRPGRLWRPDQQLGQSGVQAFLDEIEAAVPALRRYARALTGDQDMADDLVQDCI